MDEDLCDECDEEMDGDNFCDECKVCVCDKCYDENHGDFCSVEEEYEDA